VNCLEPLRNKRFQLECFIDLTPLSFLTNGMMGMERFAISFKTQFNSNVHRHVVLGIYHAGRYGAIGMSRRDDLMYKPLHFKVSNRIILCVQL